MGKENRKTLVECFLRGFRVPGAGIEPARIAPLVFETSASTDSAIRAGVLFRSLLISGLKNLHAKEIPSYEVCKGIGNFGICKIFVAMVGTNMYLCEIMFEFYGAYGHISGWSQRKSRG